MSGPQPTLIDESALASFRGQLYGEILTPADPTYEATRIVWNGMIDRRPALIACCRNAADSRHRCASPARMDWPLRSGLEATMWPAMRSATAAL
jgi:hypothetical protein